MDKEAQIKLAHELLDRVEFTLDSWITQLKEGYGLGCEGCRLEDGYGIG